MQGLPAKEIQDKNGNPGGFATARSSTYLPSNASKGIVRLPLEFKPNSETLSQGPSQLEALWEKYTSPDMQQYIKNDPVIKSVAVGGLFMVGAAVATEAIVAAPQVITS